VKTPAGYAQVNAEAATTGPEVAALAREVLLDVRQAQNLLVLKDGLLPMQMCWGGAGSLRTGPEVTGTLAGDDTVLVVAPDVKTGRFPEGQVLLEVLR